MEWLKKAFEQIKTLWGKWTLVQKLILGAVVVALIAGFVIIMMVSASPTSVQLIKTPIKNDEELRRITSALDKESIRYDLKENVIYVADTKTRERANAILIREDLIPKGTDPWAIFDIDRWTLTDFERNVNLRRAITQQLVNHIEALGDIDNAAVSLVIPEDKLFQEDQNPVSVSVIITPKPGADISTNRKKLEGIQKIIKLAVEGLKDENIVITDQNGIQLNDFANFQDVDRLEITKKEQKIIADLESQYRTKVLKSLQSTYGADRVRDLNIKIEMDMSKKSVKEKTYLPFVIKADDPKTPYDDSDIRESVTISEENIKSKWQGTGFNPEGPAGAEGQTAPAYKDMQNMAGSYETTSVKHNEAVGEKATDEEVHPSIDRITVSVNIDGKWLWKRNASGKPNFKTDGTVEREYTALEDTEIKDAEALIRDAVGFDRMRGDSVTVKNIAFDRTLQHAKEDEELLRAQQIQNTILWSLVGLAVLLVCFIIVRLVSREMERRKRLKEEELARQHQMMRESALRQAEEEGVEVSMSVEERKRLELQENAINMAKEHPEDVAQLIRTWLMEE